MTVSLERIKVDFTGKAGSPLFTASTLAGRSNYLEITMQSLLCKDFKARCCQDYYKMLRCRCSVMAKITPAKHRSSILVSKLMYYSIFIPRTNMYYY